MMRVSATKAKRKILTRRVIYLTIQRTKVSLVTRQERRIARLRRVIRMNLIWALGQAKRLKPKMLRKLQM